VHLLGRGGWASLLFLQLLQLGVEGRDLGLVLEPQLGELGLAHTQLRLVTTKSHSRSRLPEASLIPDIEHQTDMAVP